MKKCLCFTTLFYNWSTNTPVSWIWYLCMNSHFYLYLQFSFSLQDKKNYCIVHLLMFVLPHWDALWAEKYILTLGIALTPLIIYRAREHYMFSKPKRHTKTDPYIHARANHNTFHFHFFSSSSDLTSPNLYVCYVVHTRGEQEQLRAATGETSLLARHL